MRSIIVIITVSVLICPGSILAVDNISMGDFRLAYGGTVALSGSNAFVRLTDETIISQFENLTAAMLMDDLTLAQDIVDELETLDVFYRLVRIPNAPQNTIGFLEDRQPGESGYKGWGAMLFNRESTGYVIYQAPHVFADMYTRDICLQAFYENPNAIALQLTGAHRYANPDDDGDTWPDSDSAHDGDCLFHILTDYLAGYGVNQGTPFWFVQIHGSADRPDEPDIVGSNCDHEPFMTEFEPLVIIDDNLDTAGYLLSGVWGWWESSDLTQNGDYYLNGLGNLQRYAISNHGVPKSFLHYELERSIRDDYNAGSAPGYEGINHWLESIETVLGTNYFSPPITPTPLPTVTPTPTAIPTETPVPTATPECYNTGDVNMSGTITAEDSQIVFNIVLGTYTPTVEQWCAGDCDGSGWITAADSQQIFFAILGSASCADSMP